MTQLDFQKNFSPFSLTSSGSALFTEAFALRVLPDLGKLFLNVRLSGVLKYCRSIFLPSFEGTLEAPRISAIPPIRGVLFSLTNLVSFESQLGGQKA